MYNTLNCYWCLQSIHERSKVFMDFFDALHRAPLSSSLQVSLHRNRHRNRTATRRCHVRGRPWWQYGPVRMGRGRHPASSVRDPPNGVESLFVTLYRPVPVTSNYLINRVEAPSHRGQDGGSRHINTTAQMDTGIAKE